MTFAGWADGEKGEQHPPQRAPKSHRVSVQGEHLPKQNQGIKQAGLRGEPTQVTMMNQGPRHGPALASNRGGMGLSSHPSG